MRRIPRPTRAIDSSSSYLQLRSISRNRQIPACNHLCSTAAAFSTSAPYTFLLSGKQDKKKHQQFVRRWQKRLLGDSEPIGAHVDPYDPTSPVRIAPEEQGEYEEVLEEDKPGTALGNPPKAQYEPATNGHHLSHVGGELWIKHKLEQEMAREFEKLTLRTYTPLSLNMANEIEDLTGTPYTLRDENLMMAQTTHEVTARPYTAYNFGMHTKSKKPRELRARFIQAVAEVYGLKHAGLNMDVSKLSNRGIYNPPTWVKDVRLSRAQNGELILLCPKNKDVSQLIQAIQATPTWEPTFAGEEAVATEEFPLEESSEPLNTAPAQEALPTIDPDTPAFKRAAVVKMDAEKPFDFMSNRPVPRTQFLPKSERATDKTIESNASEARPLLVDAQLVELNRAVNESQSIIGELRRYFIEHRVQILDNNLEALRSAVLPAECGSAVKWSEVCIDDFVKFALFKRLFQLTGRRISDPQLTAVRTLGDLYGALCAAAQPQSATLFTTLHREGQRAREKLKQQGTTSERKANLGDLLTLGNVELRRVRPTKAENRVKTGLDKVVQYALWERGLGSGRSALSVQHRRQKSAVREGTREVPEFGRVIGSRAADYLSQQTKRHLEKGPGSAQTSSHV